MTELQAALGLSQMQRLNKYILRRRQLAASYHAQLADLPLQRPEPDNQSAWHLYIIRLDTDHISSTHRQVFESLRDQGIGVNLHYIPVHTQPWYQQQGFKQGDFPEAETYYRQAISLPLFTGLDDITQKKVV